MLPSLSVTTATPWWLYPQVCVGRNLTLTITTQLRGGFNGSDIQWGAVPDAIDYHLYRGDLSSLRSTGTYTQNPATVSDAKRFCFVGGTGQTDTYAPAAGGVLFYLITADDGFMESQLGRNAAGDLRPNTDPCR